jgi:polyhydroxyalkanoate synthesis regulator phasin
MRGTSKTYQYLIRVKKFYSDLVDQGKMKEPTRESFFRDYLGYGKTYWIKLYEKNDLRKVFYVVAELLEEVKELKEDRNKLEKQLNELLKK